MIGSGKIHAGTPLAFPHGVEKGSKPNHLVVIVGSSGSLRPLVAIAAAVTCHLDAAVVIVTHRSGKRPSYLAKILSRASCAPVVTALPGAVLRRGWVYVTPPGDHHVVIEGRTVRFLAGPKVHLQRPAGDPLFESAARSFGDRAIGIVLSGMGRDGAAGAAAIKRAGGKVFVQLPIEAEQSSMPEHALASVIPDLCAPSAELARHLVALYAPSEKAPDPLAGETQLLQARQSGAHE